jgi:hypothetical protein
MHGTFDRRPHETRSTPRGWSTALIALPVLIVIALVGMAVSHPLAAKWIAEAAQAEYVGTEFVGTDVMPNLVEPTRIAPPGDDSRGPRSNR